MKVGPSSSKAMPQPLGAVPARNGRDGLLGPGEASGDLAAKRHRQLAKAILRQHRQDVLVAPQMVDRAVEPILDPRHGRLSLLVEMLVLVLVDVLDLGGQRVQLGFHAGQVIPRRQLHALGRPADLLVNDPLQVGPGLVGGVHHVLDKLGTVLALCLPALDALVEQIFGALAGHAHRADRGRHQLADVFQHGRVPFRKGQ